jgi:hypothetical protein
MENEIISYFDMCQREHMSLQRGMNFRPASKDYSIILMSQRENAPYEDEIQDDGCTLIYQGHDVSKGAANPQPKLVDQPEFLPSGSLTENGKFKRAAENFKARTAPAERIRVYEKIRASIWSYNGLFNLVDVWAEHDGTRATFKFRLVIAEEDAHPTGASTEAELPHNRIIPSHVKQSVWKRDAGKCVLCSASDNLHFDHVIPFSKGGSSLVAENIQLLCSRHNLRKSDRIE